jgi:hypothetical protein
LAGTLDQKTLEKLLTAAATAAMVNGHRQDLARRSEHVLIGAWHRELEAGAADQILAGVRGKFDKAAAAIAHARSVIPMQSSPEHILATAGDGALEAWRTLDEHLRIVDKIGAIASQFGPRLGNFTMIKEFANADGFRLEDRAIMCTAGPLVTDSALFRQPGAHRASPWARTTLKLHTIDEARDRYRQWASDEWERLHSGPRGGWVDEHGKVHEHPKPTNPYAPVKVSS